MESATYVYCVLACPDSARLGRVPKGLTAADKPRLLAAGDYQLVVASAPLALYGAEAIDAKLRDLDWVGERAKEHEAVVEHATSIGTCVPMKLFTLFSSDARAVAHVTKAKKTLDATIARIAGCGEWGLRIFFDETRAAAEDAKKSRATPASGTGFLLRKKAEGDAKRTRLVNATERVEDLFSSLSPKAKDVRRRAAPSRELAGRVLLDAAFLVATPRAKAFTAAVASVAEPLAAEGFDVSLSGPWPAYSFIGGT